MPKQRLNELDDLNCFLASQFAAVLTVAIDETGVIHASPLAFWHDSQTLHCYFVTHIDTEKCQLLKSRSHVVSSCVVGTGKHTEYLLQMRGRTSIVAATDYAHQVEQYYNKRSSRRDDIDMPGSVLLRFIPDWARYTDYADNGRQYTIALES